MADFSALIRRFAKDESGIFAVVFGLMAIVLIALGGAVVDYVSLEQTRARAQAALDAAALALQSEIDRVGVTEESIRARAEALVLERIGDPRVTARVDRIEITPETGRLFLGGQFSLPTMFVSLVGVNELGAQFNAEAIQGSVNMEISLALDITGSMAGQRIIDLQDASYELVETILENNGGETYAKIALVPYSQAVNAGTYATALRGPIREQRTIQSITWSTGTSKSVVVDLINSRISSTNHGFVVGDWVYLSGLLNSRAYQIATRGTNWFTLTGFDLRTLGGIIGASAIKCLQPNCDPIITSNGHGYATGEQIIIANARNITDFNNRSYNIASVTANSFVLPGATFNRANSYVANSGVFYCTWQTATVGCSFYQFQNIYNATKINPVTTCVTERTPNGLNDRPPTTTFVGRNYPEPYVDRNSPGNPCLPSRIVPLTTSETTLDTAISQFTATGSTSGSLGILWSWYMLSPNFGYVWPEASRPAPYNEDDLLKAAIIMSDGEFNTVHCNGVVARNSTSGSSAYRDNSDYINCAAPNGTPYAQAAAYCNAMKNNTGIVVYTVGFGLTAGTPAATTLAACASSPENAYLAEDGDDLRDSFRQIARNISVLRLSQ